MCRGWIIIDAILEIEGVGSGVNGTENPPFDVSRPDALTRAVQPGRGIRRCRMVSRCVSVVDAVMSPQGTVVLIVKPHSEGDVGGCFSLILRFWRVRTPELILIGTMFCAQGRLGPIAIDIIMISMGAMEADAGRARELKWPVNQTKRGPSWPRPGLASLLCDYSLAASTYIRLLCCLNFIIIEIYYGSGTSREHLYRQLSPRTAVSNWCPGRLSLSLSLFLHDSHLTCSRYSVFLETSIWVSPFPHFLPSWLY